MPTSGTVLLITGPAGSGKSTLAQELARRLDWTMISEDDYWVRNGWGAGLRTSEQEGVVQHQVLADVVPVCRSGGGVVLEFILYSEPPNPLTAYEEALVRQGIDVAVVALKPTASEIRRRIEDRGRPHDLERLEQQASETENQLRILDVQRPGSCTIDSTGLSVEETAQLCLERLVGWGLTRKDTVG